MNKCTYCKDPLNAGKTTLYRCGHLLCQQCITKRRAGCNICKKATLKNHILSDSSVVDKDPHLLEEPNKTEMSKVNDHGKNAIIYKLTNSKDTINSKVMTIQVKITQPSKANEEIVHDAEKEVKKKILSLTTKSIYICNICKKVINGTVDKMHHISCLAKEKFNKANLKKNKPTTGNLNSVREQPKVVVPTNQSIRNNLPAKIRTKKKVIIKENEKKKVKDDNNVPEEVHKCDICKKSFNRIQSYHCHMRSHNKPAREKKDKFKCETCNLTFSAKWLVINHQKDHQDYVCDHCGLSYAKKDSLRIHIENIHPFKPLHCVHCFKAFKLEKVLKKHMKLHKQDLLAMKKPTTNSNPILKNKVEVATSDNCNPKPTTVNNNHTAMDTMLVTENVVQSLEEIPMKIASQSSNVTEIKIFEEEQLEQEVVQHEELVPIMVQKVETKKLPYKKFKIKANAEQPVEFPVTEVANAVQNLLEDKIQDPTNIQFSVVEDDFRHVIVLPQSKKFYCKICKAIFVDKKVKFEHLHCSTKSEVYKCDICDKTFNSNFQFKFHQHYSIDKFA